MYIATDYFGKADTTIDTFLINNNLVFAYNKNGYTSFIIGLENLFDFLNGDTSARHDTCETDDDASYSDIMREIENSLK